MASENVVEQHVHKNGKTTSASKMRVVVAQEQGNVDNGLPFITLMMVEKWYVLTIVSTYTMLGQVRHLPYHMVW